MGKRDFSEENIKARYITPAVEQSGWWNGDNRAAFEGQSECRKDYTGRV